MTRRARPVRRGKTRKPRKAAASSHWHLWPRLHLALAGAVCVAALLAVVPAQTYTMFEARVVASEGSAWVVAAGLLLLVSARPTRHGIIVAALGVAAMGIAAVPMARAFSMARDLPARLDAAFGRMAADSAGGSRGREVPLVFSDLYRGLGLAASAPKTLSYQTIEGTDTAMDVYRPAGPVPAPGVLVIHGGAWQRGTRGEFDGLSRYLAARGLVVASIDYRLAPKWPFPAAPDDVRTAIAFFKAHADQFGLDPNRLVLLGRSAGGQLALLAGYTAHDPAIRGVVSFYGPTDLVYGYEHPADPRVFDSTTMLVRFLGGHLNDRKPAYLAASPIEYVGRSTPPTLLIHGTPDELVEIEQSRRLDRRLSDAQVPHLLVELPWASHGCDYFLRGPCGQISTYAVERFLSGVLGN